MSATAADIATVTALINDALGAFAEPAWGDEYDYTPGHTWEVDEIEEDGPGQFLVTCACVSGEGEPWGALYDVPAALRPDGTLDFDFGKALDEEAEYQSREDAIYRAETGNRSAMD